ncbi:hypothetical protein APSETT444_009611 [Aspergillus pseudonomiae]
MACHYQKLLWGALTLGVSVSALPGPLKASRADENPSPPVATIKSSNSQTETVFVGRSLPEFDQELFLGVKYADKPIRFTPSSLKTVYTASDSDSGLYTASVDDLNISQEAVLYNATEYGYECPGYGSDETKLVDMGLIQLNEDCHNLNIIRPKLQPNETQLLPVMLWIFGGGWQQGATADPRGAYSVGAHLVANGGDNEGLFRADTLQCLRDVSYETLYDAAYEGLEWFAAIDGTFIKEYPQISITQGNMAKVPILLGTNTDEGTSFGTTGTNTDDECIEQLISSKRWVLDREQATKLLTFYPNDPALGCPYGWGNTTWPDLGLMYKRYESMAGDLTMVGPRRLLAQNMAKYKNEVYSYRWDVPALNTSSTIGVGHFAEIPFVFANPVQNITALGDDPARLELGNLAARMWTSFVADLDPNEHNVANIPVWPQYSQETSNFVFRLPKDGSYIEADTYREDGIEYINSIPR